MKKISIINQKGGTGKTTTSINLSAGLTREGKKVLLIDLDPQAHSTLGIGINPEEIEYSIYDVLVNKETIHHAIIPSYIKNLDVIPSHIKLAAGVEQIYSRMFREAILDNALKRLDSPYNFIILDCPPALGVLTTNAVYTSDFMIIPCQMSRYSLDGLSDLLDTLEVVKGKDEKKQRYYGILLTIFDKRNTVTNEYILNQLAPYKEFIFKTIIMRNESLNQAHIAQKAIFDFEPKSIGAKNYHELAKEVLRFPFTKGG